MRQKQFKKKQKAEICKDTYENWIELFNKDPKQFELKILFIIENCCKKRGMIKVEKSFKKNSKFTKKIPFETYKEGTEKFIDEQINAIKRRFKKELTGKAKPFLTKEKRFKTAAKIFCYKRINTYYRKFYLQKVLKDLTRDEYIFSNKISAGQQNEGLPPQNELARPASINRFGEAIDHYNRTPESYFEEAEFCKLFLRVLEQLKSKGKYGTHYYKTIQFYTEGHYEGQSKHEEISLLSKLLGVDRKKAREIKCRAIILLSKRLSKYYSLDKCKKGLKNKILLKKRFKKISEKKLLKLYDKRNSYFLDPHLDEKVPRLIRRWKVIKGGNIEGNTIVTPDRSHGLEALNEDLAV